MSEREQYTGAWATPDLIGREPQIADIDRALQAASGPTVIAVYGRGGIGKTRVLQDALKRWHNRNHLTTQQVIDLYDIQYHNSLDLAIAVYKALKVNDNGDNALTDFERDLDRWRRAQASGDSKQIEKVIKDVLSASSVAMKSLTQRRPVLIALDTVERVAYGASESVAPFEVAQSWKWLIETLPEWGNVRLIIAGRNQIKHLFHGIQNQNLALTAIELPPFSEEETRNYLQAVAAVARDAGERSIADTLSELSLEQSRKIHRFSGGLPILLALLADYISIAGFRRLPQVFQNEMDPDQARPLLEQQLIERLIETSQIRDTLLMLGRAPKGLNAELLANLLEISQVEAQRRLERIQRLSFVKTRNNLFFLHDEMYAFLHRQVYSDPGDAPEAERVNTVLINWYDKQIKQYRQQLDKRFTPVEQSNRSDSTTPRLDFNQIARIQQNINQLLVDQLYYYLRRNPLEGSYQFVRLIFLSIFGANPLLSTHAQAEVLTFFHEREHTNQLSNFSDDDIELIKGIIQRRRLFELYAVQKYEEVVNEAEQLLQQNVRREIDQAMTKVWKILALASSGQGNIETLIAEVEPCLKRLAASSKEGSDLQSWLARLGLALLYHAKGYASNAATRRIEAYQLAVKFWRRVDIPIGLAWTLNNLGFAHISSGNLQDGLALIQETIEIRQKIGERAQIGIGYATLSLAHLHSGNPKQARELADRGLRLCRAVNYKLGEGLALRNIAEIQRRSTIREESPEKRLGELQEALSYAREATSIFEEMNNQPHLIEALIEEGCTLRDMASILRSQSESSESVENWEELLQESKRVLSRAAELAKDRKQLSKAIDAYVTLAAIGIVAKDFKLLSEWLKRVEAEIPVDYQITTQGKPDRNKFDDHSLFWQLARSHIRIGDYLLASQTEEEIKRLAEHYRDLPARFSSYAATEIKGRSDILNLAIRHYTLAFEYDDLYNPYHVRSQAVQDRLLKQIKEFDFENLRTVAEAVSSVEKEFKLRNSFMRHLLQRRTLLLNEEDV